MRSDLFKDVKLSVYIFAFILLFTVIFYFVASMFTSVGYANIGNSVSSAAFMHNIEIILDAGHGGEDPGAEANGIQEKTVNLDITLKLNEILRANGYSVTLTRSEDIMLYEEEQSARKKFYDLDNRVKIANSNNNAIFLSIHMNKYPAEYCQGLQTFYSNKNNQNLILANCVQNNITDLQPYNKRTVKENNDTIYLLRNIEIPAALIECVFLSNNDEANLIQLNEYRTAMALSIYCGITEYLENINEN